MIRRGVGSLLPALTVVLLIATFCLLVWPTPFRYEHWAEGNIVRINRATQTVDLLTGGGWRRIRGTGWHSRTR